MKELNKAKPINRYRGVLYGLWAGLIMASGSAAANCTFYNDAVASSTPTEDFVVHGDSGTVTHSPTGLMWKQCSQAQVWDGSTCTGTADTFFQWQGALEEADGHEFAGYSDWRLPNVKELKSIVERQCRGAAVNALIFPETPTGSALSASPYPPTGSSNRVWAVNFNSGVVLSTSTTGYGAVRLVREGD